MVALPFAIVLIVAAIAVVVLGAIGALMLIRGGRRSNLPGPVCGACGYALAPNPTGLTVCPECGGDFLAVGILAPGMKRGRRANPAVPLGIAWFMIVGVGMVPLHGQLVRTFTKLVTTATVRQTVMGSGPFASLGITADREQVVGEKQPQALTADVTLTGPDGKSVEITVDGRTRLVTKAPASTGLLNAPWDDAAAGKLLAAVGSEDADQPSRKRVREEVDDAMEKTAGGGSFGGMGIGSWSSSSSTSGLTPPSRSRSRGFVSSGSSSSYSGGNAPVVLIGSLRGVQWVTLITCATGLTLAFGGLGLILLLTRERR